MVTRQIPFGDTIPLANIRNRSIGGGLLILNPTNLTPTSSPVAWFIIYAVFQDDGTLSVIRDGNTVEMLNEGDDLLADTAYMFIFPVSQGETIDFVYSTSTTISKLLVLEIIREP